MAVAEISRRPVPSSEEAEIAVLSCAFLSPQDAIHTCAERVKPEHFYRPAHRTIFETLMSMSSEAEAIDLVTVTQRLTDQRLLDKVGGADYLHEILTSEATSANLTYYLDILHQKFVLRQLIETGTDIVKTAYEGTRDADDLLDEFEKNVFSIRDKNEAAGQRGIKQIIDNTLHKIDQIHESRGKLKGVSWGFRDLNKVTFGLNPGNMIVVAARPGVGKTALAMNVAERLVLPDERDIAEGVNPVPVAVFSMEMTAEELAMRMIFQRAKVNMYDLREGRLTRSDLEKLVRVGSRMASSPLHIDDTPGISIMQLRAKARRMKKQHDIQLVVIDYLQLVRSERRRDDNREREVAEISGQIKALAKELNLPIIVISQLNRESVKDGAKPTIANLRESGAIEQDADIVCLLADPKDMGEEEKGYLHVLIAKNRHGMTSDERLTFIRQYTRFEDFVDVDGASSVP